MAPPYEKLRDAFEEQKRVTVTEQDGTVHESCGVEDVTHVRTGYFEIWRFVLRGPGIKKTLFGPDLKTVEVLG